MRAANIDLKAFSEDFYHHYCGARLRPVLDNLVRMRALGWWLEVTTLILEGLNDGEAELRALARFIRDELGADTSLVGFAVSSFAYTALALKLISAPAIDSFNRKWLLAASLGILAVSYLIMSLSTTIVMLIVARLLQGCAMTFTTTRASRWRPTRCRPTASARVSDSSRWPRPHAWRWGR